MDWDDVLVLATRLEAVSIDDVESLERDTGVTFPSGWRDFITRFGEGSYCDLFRIYAPARIRAYTQEYRDRWAEYWSFEESERLLSSGQAQESVPVGDTLDGDEMVFHPAQPDRIFMLPRHSDEIAQLRADFADLHQWESPGGRLRTFMPFARRAVIDLRGKDFSIDADAWLDECVAHWGREAVVEAHRGSRGQDWDLVLFITAIAGRMQVIASSGERHIEHRAGGTITYQGSGEPHLWVNVDCDEGTAEDVRRLISEMSARGVAVLAEQPPWRPGGSSGT